MKTSIILLMITCLSFSSLAQKSTSRKSLSKNNSTNKMAGYFSPDSKLLNTDLWTRVAENRYECNFLRLAVELKNREYFLSEMDGGKRVLAHSLRYSDISIVIINLTLNNGMAFKN